MHLKNEKEKTLLFVFFLLKIFNSKKIKSKDLKLKLQNAVKKIRTHEKM